MKFTLASVAALLVAGVQVAAVPVLEPRIDGCPAEAPWPMGNPDTFWYPICCAYVLGDGTCCNRHPEDPREWNGVVFPACPGA